MSTYKCIYTMFVFLVLSYLTQDDISSSIHLPENLMMSFFVFCFLRRGFSVYPWMSWILLGRLGWPQTQKSACVCLSSAGIKGMHHHCPAYKLFLNVIIYTVAWLDLNKINYLDEWNSTRNIFSFIFFLITYPQLYS